MIGEIYFVCKVLAATGWVITYFSYLYVGISSIYTAMFPYNI